MYAVCFSYSQIPTHVIVSKYSTCNVLYLNISQYNSCREEILQFSTKPILFETELVLVIVSVLYAMQNAKLCQLCVFACARRAQKSGMRRSETMPASSSMMCLDGVSPVSSQPFSPQRAPSVYLGPPVPVQSPASSLESQSLATDVPLAQPASLPHSSRQHAHDSHSVGEQSNAALPCNVLVMPLFPHLFAARHRC